ncbi:Plastocyanin-like [Macleaya cordata]|uniref:Plastocyanin-like n=1 Tax=Macleaya cordata TaxID=56857 RepID=A0A200QEE7_MACCD|nr:Plastocyanin-like [Macleaya cordata]
MEFLMRSIMLIRGSGVVWLMIRILFLLSLMMMIQCVYSVAIYHEVGQDKGWQPGTNYTEWARHERFYVGDCLFFRYNKSIYDVLEVNRIDYGACSPDHPVANVSQGTELNIANGTGQDIFNMSHPGRYYFLSSGGYCQEGMRLSVDVHEKIPSTSHQLMAALAASLAPSTSSTFAMAISTVLVLQSKITTSSSWRFSLF